MYVMSFLAGRIMQAIIELIAGVIISIVVLLILAKDRLDGDELYKGLLAGGACVGSIKAAQSKFVRHILRSEGKDS